MPLNDEIDMQTKLLINGALVAGEGDHVDVYNPSLGRVLVQTHEASHAQVHAAVQSADAAFEAWSQTPPKDRAALLLTLADRIDAQAAVFARLEADNCGKPFTAVLQDELPAVSDVFRFFAGCRSLPARLGGGRVHPGAHLDDPPRRGRCRRLHRAVELPVADGGVEARPGLGRRQHRGPEALRAHPDEHLEAGELLADIFPAGVVNIVHGRGATVGEPLTSHALVRMVSLTGSVRTGSRIIEGTADSVKRMHMELGEKPPC